jgi:hypothetical protein
MGFFVVSCINAVWVSVSVGQGYVPTLTIVVSLLLVTLGLLLLVPYFAYVFDFLEPGRVIARIGEQTLASALGRGEDGNPQYHAPVLWSIELSRVLTRTHLIAEAWDAGGLYQVGDFPGFRWAEWNGNYRDTIRYMVD